MDLTLQKISLNYFSANVLCNTPEMNNLILNTAYLEISPEMSAIRFINNFKRIESKAKKLLSKMPEMGIFKNMVLDMLFPITCRIYRWKVKYARTIDNVFLNYFYWKNAGRIDNGRTARYIIQNTMIPITKRFVLACSFCLVNQVNEIWVDMSNDDRSALMEENHGEINHLFHFWISCQRKKIDEVRRNLQPAIICAVKIGSIEAVRFLFNFIPPRAKSEMAFLSFYTFSVIIKSCFCLHENFIYVGYFLYRNMNESHKRYLLSTDWLTLLTLLLYPSGQSRFLNAVKNNIQGTSEFVLKWLLAHITCKISTDFYRDYEYFNLFIGIWKILPEETLRNLKDNPSFLEYGFCRIVFTHFRIILLNNKSKKTKKTNILAKRFLVNQDKWKLMLFLIKKEIVTAESLRRNKINVLNYLHIRKTKKPAWRRLLKFVKDNGLQKQN